LGMSRDAFPVLHGAEFSRMRDYGRAERLGSGLGTLAYLLLLLGLTDAVVDRAAPGLAGPQVAPDRWCTHQRESPMTVALDVADHLVPVPRQFRTDEGGVFAGRRRPPRSAARGAWPEGASESAGRGGSRRERPATPLPAISGEDVRRRHRGDRAPDDQDPRIGGLRHREKNRQEHEPYGRGLHPASSGHPLTAHPLASASSGSGARYRSSLARPRQATLRS
jgi:hypothetical protein